MRNFMNTTCFRKNHGLHRKGVPMSAPMSGFAAVSLPGEAIMRILVLNQFYLQELDTG